MTERPWMVDASGESVFIREPDGSPICQMKFLCGGRFGSERRPHDEIMKTAHKLAAAPALYEALREARGWVDLCEDLGRDVSEPLARIDAALARAQGGE